MWRSQNEKEPKTDEFAEEDKKPREREIQVGSESCRLQIGDMMKGGRKGASQKDAEDRRSSKWSVARRDEEN